MTKLTTGTFIVVADGEKALLLENIGDAEDPHFRVAEKEEQENPPNRDQAANRRGRFNDGPTAQRSAVDDTDWHQLAKERFADDLADLLYKKVHAGRIDRLVLVASPMILGELRDALHQEVRGCVVGEIDKTLTNHPVDKIEDIVKGAI